jgi:ligand-binding sensor domain-containing protein
MLLMLVALSGCERNSYEVLDPESAGVWTTYTTDDGLPGNRVSDIMLDSKNNLWFTCPGFGSARLESSEIVYYRSSTSPILNDGVNCIDEASDGSILFGTVNGLSELNPDESWLSYTDPTNVLYINTILVSSNGWRWIGTQAQGLYLDAGNGYAKILNTEYRNIKAIEEDRAGNIFIGTDNGIVKYDGTGYSTITVKNGLPSDRITSLRYDSRDRLWIGTEGGKVASWMDQKGVISSLNLMAGTDNIHIRDIFEDSQGNIWFATAENGAVKYDGVITTSYKEYNGFPENSVNCIASDIDGNLWFGLENRGVVKYTLPIGLK